MDDQSDEDLDYRRSGGGSHRFSRKRDSSDSHLSISDEDDEDNGDLLEIKPPQAKILKHSHYRHPYRSSYGGSGGSGRDSYSGSGSGHRHAKASHHSRRYADERHYKERYESMSDFKQSSSRSSYVKEYETDRPSSKEYDEYRRKKASYERHSRREEKMPPSSTVKEDRYKSYAEDYRYEEQRAAAAAAEQDLREKIERRKLHHQKQQEYERKERKEREHRKKHSSATEVMAATNEAKRHDERSRRRHHGSEGERKHRARTPPPTEKSRGSRREKSVISPSATATATTTATTVSSREKERETVIDVEMSPPVYKSQYSERQQRNDEETQKEGPKKPSEKQRAAAADAPETSSVSGSSSSSESSEEANTNSGSSSEAEEEEEEEGEEEGAVDETQEQESGEEDDDRSTINEQEDEEDEEDEEEDDENLVEEMSPMAIADHHHGHDIDTEIELEKDTLPAYFPAIQGCRSVEEFQCLNRIQEGTYGVVYRAREKKTDKIVALKRLKMEKEKDGFPITSLREINTLLKAQHPNIVTVKEIVVGSNMDKIFIVMDYVEHDLKTLMESMKQKKNSFMVYEVKCLMQQLLRAVGHLHDNWILHRDLKTSNLLFSDKGVLKVGDFGLAREYGSPLKHYTPVVVTLWYRAPELLLGAKEYSTSVDMWSVGCIFAEFLTMEPLFPGKTEVDQLNKIFKGLGTPNERIWPEYPTLPVSQRVSFPEFPAHGVRSKFSNTLLSDLGYELLLSFLTYNTKTRITAEVALKHKYFSESPLPIEPNMFESY